MRTELDHLPATKRQDLERIVQILFDEFADATRIATQDWKRKGRILKIVLFGSYARGDWVEDAKGGYFSDYDILVVVSDRRLTDTLEFWAKADDHLMRAVTIEKSISAPVNFIVHDLADVNEQLRHGRPFFVDIARDGIALYQFEGVEFDQPRPLTRADRQAEAQKYFDEWFESAVTYFETGTELARLGKPKEAAFLLHQATERFYHAVLLVLTLYSPKSHKLNFLRSQAESHTPELIEVWPRDTRFAQRSFELLRRAYVDARYSPHYQITPQELEWLGERIELLQTRVRQICEKQLALG
ncbi:nucleotidyltransferase and HEPN domain-containing protein [Sphingomonas asaccharolytica]|uniref:nucleotidyltransferase and HEPN domain-containing protein n=1 Tax=Sphingomonas asaccharolytica TaxID=40681 RepID=UPI00082BC003|nr:nucleotidyltransferase and HEPN domain-containing protein [Sphingomonas asaccharolytica]